MKKALRPIQFLCVWIYIALYTSAYVVFTLLTFKRFSDSVLPFAAHYWAKGILFLIGVSLEVEGEQHMRGLLPRIVTFNHQSALDLLVLMYTLPPGSVAIAKKEFKYIPFINLAMWAMNYRFIDRSNRSRALKSLDGLPEFITTHSRSLLISPEGTRTPTGELQQFKKGAFRIALEGKIPIYPVVISGAFDLLPKQRVFPQPGIMKVRYLPPIDTTSWQKQDLDKHIANVRERFIEALNECSADKNLGG